MKAFLEKLEKIKSHVLILGLIFVGILFIALNLGGFSQLAGLIRGFSSQPLFDSTDNFALFASEELKLEQGTQVSSGDIGSNRDLDAQKDVIVNGNLFADKITLDKNTAVNGSVSYNKLKTQKETQIFGSTTTPVSLPIATLPAIPDFPTGTQDKIFTGTSTSNILIAGNYRNITIEKNSRLILTGGIYNLRKIELRGNSVLIFATSTTLNIKEELFAQQKISILPDANVKFDDLKINFKSQKPVEFGKRSFLNFKLFAPNAQVHVGEEATVRGQILAKKIKIGKGSILSREENFEKESDPAGIVQDEDGTKLIVNELIILFVNEVTITDAQSVANFVNGIITGFISLPPIYKIEVSATTIAELNNSISKIKNSGNSLIIEAIPNFIGEPIL